MAAPDNDLYGPHAVTENKQDSPFCYGSLAMHLHTQSHISQDSKLHRGGGGRGGGSSLKETERETDRQTDKQTDRDRDR